MRCFGPDPDECCSFYDPHDGGKCLKECGSERRVTEIFDCAGMYMYNVVLYIHVVILQTRSTWSLIACFCTHRHKHLCRTLAGVHIISPSMVVLGI